MYRGGLPESFELYVTDTFIFLIFTPLTTIMMMICVCARRRPPWEFWATHRQALSNSASLGCSDRWEIKTKTYAKDKYNDEYKYKHKHKYRHKLSSDRHEQDDICLCFLRSQNFLQCDRDFLTTQWYESQVGKIIVATLHRQPPHKEGPRQSAISKRTLGQVVPCWMWYQWDDDAM